LSVSKIDDFQVPEITSVLANLARLDFKSEMMFSVSSRILARKNFKLSADDLGKIAFAFAKLKFDHPKLFTEVLGKQILSLCGGNEGLKPKHVVSIVGSFTRMGWHDSKVFNVLGSEIARKSIEYSPGQIVIVLKSYKAANIQNKFLFELLLEEAFRKRLEFTSKETAGLLQVLGDGGVRHPKLIEFFKEKTAKEINKLNIDNLSLIIQGISKCAEGTLDDLFSSATRRVSEIATTVELNHLTRILESYARKGFRDEVFFNECGKFFLRKIKDNAELKECADLLAAFSWLGLTDEKILRAVSERIQSNEIKEIPVGVLVSFLDSFAKSLYIAPCESILDSLAGRLLTAKDKLVVARAKKELGL
jgi:hypothetical protein